MSRTNLFASLGLMPALMGLGHLAPAIGAIHTATGSYQFPGSVLGLIGTISALVDSIDKYKDTPLSRRPRKWVWKTWTYSLSAICVACAFMSGLQTVLLVLRPLPLGLLWSARCVPLFSKSGGLLLIKPKSFLGEAKSFVVALCMASVCAQASMAYYCQREGSHCSEDRLRWKSFQLACLYQFLRETACDVRDIREDTIEGLHTLPVKLGKQRTLLLMALIGLLLDMVITQSVLLTAAGSFVVRFPHAIYSCLRIGSTIAAYSLILQYPRANIWAWGTMSLFGLTPVLFAQAALNR
ncbi:hypothetical protein ONS95_006520 [Cadophora gregata]|uniref:uncharacterized protein n=1 Tax=Cadophora gregata TaxID=51156 RepID=UPI0026DAD389|nr:uncharacterized protein ONS95_006520 [Cadophora gregata]KAK0101344.1 hypothetical protein ONS95_006520 [Cadophora gregata]